MTELKPSAWDRTWGAVPGATEDALIRRSFAERSGAFERAWGVLNAGGEVGEESLRALAEDYRARVEEAGRPPRSSRAEVFAWQLVRPRIGFGSAAEVGGAIVAFGLFGLLFVLIGGGAVIALVALLIWAGFQFLVRASGATRQQRALESMRCPDCGYDLSAAPAALPVEQLGVNVGPRACPECGAGWPLVPPRAGR